jgi:hypothetical protein
LFSSVDLIDVEGYVAVDCASARCVVCVQKLVHDCCGVSATAYSSEWASQPARHTRVENCDAHIRVVLLSEVSY